MKVAEQTQQQIERFLKKIAQKFTASDCNQSMTDLHLRASQDSGDLMAFDDNDNEITRCVIEEWIDDKNCITELYLVDDDLGIIGGDLMQGLDKDLDSFLQNILEEDA